MAPTRDFPAWLTRQSYWLAAGVPLLLPLAWLMCDWPGMGVLFAWVPVLTLYGLLPVADWLVGRDLSDPDPKARCYYTDIIIPLVATLSYLVVLP